MNLLHSAEKSPDKAHLPVLQGCCAGYAVALSVVEDTIGWRKVPPLWLLVEGEGSRPSRGSLDFIVPPAITEVYPLFRQWDGTPATPASWRQHAVVEYHEQPANVGMLERHVPPLFAVGKVQELLPDPIMGPEKGKPCTCLCPPRQRNRSLIRCLTLGTRLDGYVRQQTDGNSATT